MQPLRGLLGLRNFLVATTEAFAASAAEMKPIATMRPSTWLRRFCDDFGLRSGS